ncbi:MAG: hypothetical protein AB1489_21725, partial [Acidobacteriota bacterium]
VVGLLILFMMLLAINHFFWIEGLSYNIDSLSAKLTGQGIGNIFFIILMLGSPLIESFSNSRYGIALTLLYLKACQINGDRSELSFNQHFQQTKLSKHWWEIYKQRTKLFLSMFSNAAVVVGLVVLVTLFLAAVFNQLGLPTGIVHISGR